jgi:hypothetical protein
MASPLLLMGERRTFVGVSLDIMGRLVLLVDGGILGGSGSRPKACVGILRDVLVCLLGCSGASSLDGLRNVVCGVLVDILVVLGKGQVEVE